MTTLLHRARFRRDHRWAPRHMSAYVEGDLGRRRRHRLQQHVRECPECQRILLGLQRMLGRLRAVPATVPEQPPDIASAVRRRLHERRDE